MSASSVVVGIDVAKAHVDVAVLGAKLDQVATATFSGGFAISCDGIAGEFSIEDLN